YCLRAEKRIAFDISAVHGSVAAPYDYEARSVPEGKEDRPPPHPRGIDADRTAPPRGPNHSPSASDRAQERGRRQEEGGGGSQEAAQWPTRDAARTQRSSDGRATQRRSQNADPARGQPRPRAEEAGHGRSRGDLRRPQERDGSPEAEEAEEEVSAPSASLT